MTPELETLKSRLKATWSAGDFGQIAKATASGAEEFIKRLNLQPGMKVLDVACGTGNQALPAARLGAIVTAVDIAPNLIKQARENAEREGLKIQFDEGDAEALPYEDASFDAVVTMFGAMFAPRPELVAAELKRVCKPGGFIAMANWTPTGFVGRMFKTVSNHVPPPPGIPPPAMWGDAATVRERLREGISKLETNERSITIKFPFPPADVVEHFRNYFGPAQKAFDSLDEKGQAALRRDLEQLWLGNNRATDGTTLGEAEYLEVIAVRS
ncbi:MAG TPA: class I SAM-dependent methyltransferase [Pyrinomonadaceae bacterium]|nr:class I SAM-dependent methyltransferase [Pyrinomonadaceae bacterium]